MFQEQFEELKHTGKLPTPSGLGLRILMLTRRDDCSMDEIVQTIQADPALTGRILKLANSTLVAGSHPATSVREAAVRLGLRAVSNVALGFSLISSNRTGRCDLFDYDGYWSWSLASAMAAQRLGNQVRLVTPAEAFTCALLSRIGRLALASVYPREYSEVLTRSLADHSLDLAMLEKETFSIQHREVAAAMLDDWGLPPFFSETVLHFGEVNLPAQFDAPQCPALLQLLEASSRTAEVLTSSQPQGELFTVAQRAAGELGVETSNFSRIYDEVVSEWKVWGELMRVPTGPAVSSQQLESLARTADRADGAGSPQMRILAVDDEPVSLRRLVAQLESSGHQVRTARNGREALAIVLREPPQMVITDWMMPEMDGLELCKQLRSTSAGRNLYILILTGHAQEERILEAFEAGADDYIVKPSSPADFHGMLKLLMARIRPGIRVIQLQEQLQRENDEKELARKRFQKESITDALTELPNRRYAMDRLEMEWATSGRSKLPLSLILLDIDHFKQINDNHGHDVGDVVLRATARAIKSVLRRGDTCARIGGEEFLVMCPATDVEGARRLAERIRVAVRENIIQVRDYRGAVTVSLGIGYRTGDTDSIDSLLKAADQSVYLAKRLGRDRVELTQNKEDKRSA